MEKKPFFFFEFDIERDKEKRPSDEVAHDGIIEKETKSEDNESCVHGVADEGIGAICDESTTSIWFGNDAQAAATAQGEKCPDSDARARAHECPGHDVLRTEGLLDGMEEEKISQEEKLNEDEYFGDRG